MKNRENMTDKDKFFKEVFIELENQFKIWADVSDLKNLGSGWYWIYQDFFEDKTKGFEHLKSEIVNDPDYHFVRNNEAFFKFYTETAKKEIVDEWVSDILEKLTKMTPLRFAQIAEHGRRT